MSRDIAPKRIFVSFDLRSAGAFDHCPTTPHNRLLFSIASPPSGKVGTPDGSLPYKCQEKFSPLSKTFLKDAGRYWAKLALQTPAQEELRNHARISKFLRIAIGSQ